VRSRAPLTKVIMSSSDQTHLKLVTVGDLDPQSEGAIEYDFIGRVIAGRYTVREHIGGGGMADVFQASDEQLGIDVAIKLLKPRMASDELRARMVQEAQAAAQVRHANLVRVFGTGKLDATAYIAMELLAGPNLEQYVREYRGQRIPWKEALALLLPALEALHAIHERGYIHRDIKPGNILVTRDPARPARVRRAGQAYLQSADDAGRGGPGRRYSARDRRGHRVGARQEPQRPAADHASVRRRVAGCGPRIDRRAVAGSSAALAAAHVGPRRRPHLFAHSGHARGPERRPRDIGAARRP